MKSRSANIESASPGSVPWRYIVVGGGLLALGAALDGLSSRRCSLHKESMLDEALDKTFPASDPRSTQDFTAPEDRLAL